MCHARFSLNSLALLALLGGLVSAAPLPGHEFADLKKEAQKAAARGDLTDFAAKLRDCARDDSKRAAEFISDLAVRVPDMGVYRAACEAIAGMRSEEATDGINELVAKEHNPMVKILLIDAIAARDDERSIPGIVSALGDRTEEVLRAAIAAAKRRKLTQAVDPLIEIVGRIEDKEEGSLLLNQVRECLLAITGEQFAKAQDWHNYWEPRKASFRPITGEPAKPLASTSERPRPRFFGSEIRSKRLVFVIDTSGSMEAADPAPPMRAGDPAAGPGGGSRVRMERAKQQLKLVVAALPEDVSFTMVAYSGALFQSAGGITLPQGTPEDGPLPPTLGGFEWLKTFKPRLCRANARTKQEATQWIDALQANGATFTYNALKAAFEVEGADTIVLLSDGVPTEFDRKNKTADGHPTEMTTDKILDEVEAMNRFRRMRIDTFGFDPSGGSYDPSVNGGGSVTGGHRRHGGSGGGGLSAFMQDLAEANGGGYTPIP